MITIKCDRCGVYYDIYNVKRDRENTNGIMFLNIDENGGIGLGNPIDLCPECMEDVRNFVQGVGLFRGKRKDNGEWICGEITIYDEPKYKAIKTCIKLNTGIYEIDPDTLCQYTGLKDKNGVKIFENDIVTNAEFCPDNKGYGVIQWNDDEAMFVVDADICCFDFDHIFGGELEVIGNVFDDRELIGGIEG